MAPFTFWIWIICWISKKIRWNGKPLCEQKYNLVKMSEIYQKKWLMSSEKNCLILLILLYKLSDLTFCAKNLLMNQEKQSMCSTWSKHNLWLQKYCCISTAARNPVPPKWRLSWLFLDCCVFRNNLVCQAPGLSLCWAPWLSAVTSELQ